MSQTDIYKIMRTQDKWFRVKELSEVLGIRDTSVTRGLTQLIRYEFIEVRVVLNSLDRKINEYKILPLDKPRKSL